MLRIVRKIILAGLIASFSTIALAIVSSNFNIVKGPVDFSSYRGKWVVINYWATWCNACLVEIPGLNAFYNSHRNQIVMFGVNYEDGPLESLSKRVQESGVNFPTLTYDPKNLFDVDSIIALPTTLLIGPDGRLKRMLIGVQTKQDLENALGLS